MMRSATKCKTGKEVGGRLVASGEWDEKGRKVSEFEFASKVH